MKDEFIKREDVLSLKHRLHNHSKDTIELYPVYVISPDAVLKIPSADVAEVKHGKWCEFMKDPINQRNYGGQTGYYECSNCKFVEDYRPNFCPNCGADMRGGT